NALEPRATVIPVLAYPDVKQAAACVCALSAAGSDPNSCGAGRRLQILDRSKLVVEQDPRARRRAGLRRIHLVCLELAHAPLEPELLKSAWRPESLEWRS